MKKLSIINPVTDEVMKHRAKKVIQTFGHISEEEIHNGVAENLANGTLEIVGKNKDGEPTYRLSEEGKKRAEEIIKESYTKLYGKKP